MVWTSVGGAVQYVECCCVSRGQAERQGRLMLTGQVGEVLEESARIALSWIRSHASQIQPMPSAADGRPPSDSMAGLPDSVAMGTAGATTGSNAAQSSGPESRAEAISAPGAYVSPSGSCHLGHRLFGMQGQSLMALLLLAIPPSSLVIQSSNISNRQHKALV